MGLKMFGIFAIIPATVLLTISFFVLFAKRMIEARGLKVFGCIIVILLWICAALILGGGIYTMAKGRCPMMRMMYGMKGGMWGPQMPGKTEHPMQQHMMMR